MEQGPPPHQRWKKSQREMLPEGAGVADGVVIVYLLDPSLVVIDRELRYVLPVEGRLDVALPVSV